MPQILLGDGVAINHVRLGEASEDRPVLVLVHGLATSSAFWLPAAQRFAQDHPVLLYDLRGHGRSSMPAHGYTPTAMADDLTRLLDRLHIGKVVLVAHSFGGSVALRGACLRQDRVAAMVLADARVRLLQPTQTPRSWPRWAALKPGMDAAHISIDEDDPEGGYALLTELARGQVSGHGPMRVPAWVAKVFGQGGSRFAAARWLELLDKTTAWDDLRTDEGLSHETIASLRLPVLAVYGEHSPVLPTAHALSHIWPHMDFRLMAGAGHFFPLTSWEEFAEVVSTFLQGMSGGVRTEASDDA